jgi:hypothetical protein
MKLTFKDRYFTKVESDGQAKILERWFNRTVNRELKHSPDTEVGESVLRAAYGGTA